MADASITRREFIERGAMVAALMSAGRLPLLGQGIVSAATPGPACVQPVTGYLGGFAPALAGRALGAEYTLAYDIVHWNRTDGKTWVTVNDVLGSLRIARSVSEEGPRYDVEQTMTYSGVENRLEAAILCNDDELNTLRRWRVKWSASAGGKPIPQVHLADHGYAGDGLCRLWPEQPFPVAGPLVSQWTILDLLARRAGERTDVCFRLLDDLSRLKEDQHLRYDGQEEIDCARGHVTLASFLQTGRGIHPRHYLVDDRGLPQLVTAAMMSWALRSVG